MAIADKTSVRNEVTHLKSNFDELCSKGKVTDEVKVLINSMFVIIELILSIFLEKKTRKTKNNSSLPPSQTDPDDSSLNKGGHGKSKKENSQLAKNSKTVETTELSPVNMCNVCGENLERIPCTGTERRTKIDIMFEKVVTHIDAEIKICSNCDSEVKGVFPNDMPGSLQYGNGLKIFIINLLICQMVAMKRVQHLINSMMGRLLSEATLLKYIIQLHDSLEKWEEKEIEKMLNTPSINVDETSLRVDKKKQWIHVYSSGDTTLKFLKSGRGKEAINEINMIPRYGGVIIHDCLAAYFSYEHCGHAVCGSHLLRELTFLVDSNDYVWAKLMKRCLKKACIQVSKSAEKKLTDKAYANLQKQYRNILTRGKQELPIIPPKPSGKRGKLAKSDAHNLWERLEKRETAVLQFAKNAQVSFTNNRAERDLRMAKVKQKISGCFRAQKHAEAYCRISSYIQTMANKGHNPLIAIEMALSGNID